jgi:hypothetical protein
MFGLPSQVTQMWQLDGFWGLSALMLHSANVVFCYGVE